MPIPLPDLTHAALLSMDFQNFIVSQYTGNQDGFMERVAGVLDAARKLAIPVIHVQVGFRPGLPEVNDRNALFAAVKASPQWQQAFAGESGKLHPAAAPQGNEVVVTKHRVSAFTGTDLEMILRAGEIDTLILMGIATSGVVLATLANAMDADYRLVVIGDCCADRDAELHASLMEKYFSRMATVIDSPALTAAMAVR